MRMLPKSALLMLPMVLVLTGCLEEDTISITGDGVVTFKSLVTVSDDNKKISFADADKGLSDLVAELQKAKWTVERKWLSEKRPYTFEVTGTGNLHEVAPSTRLYTLTPVVSGFYRVVFIAPWGEDGTLTVTHRRIIFTTIPDAVNASVHDAEGHLVTQIENVAAGGGPYGIRLRPSQAGARSQM
jgi:hypothetical protein